MDVGHLHLHVRDRARSCAFYERWFGLRHAWSEGEISFVRGDRGFDLALLEDAQPQALPDWFHFGFQLPDADAVARLYEGMHQAAVPMPRALYRDAVHASFRCTDPDGYLIEVYWDAPGRGQRVAAKDATPS